jgi:hypothetical protein
MRAVPLLLLLIWSLAGPATRDMPGATAPAEATMIGTSEAEYLALQAEADQALASLT